MILNDSKHHLFMNQSTSLSVLHCLPMILKFFEISETNPETSKDKLYFLSGQQGKSVLDLALERGLSKYKDRFFVIESLEKNMRHGFFESVYCVGRSFFEGLKAWRLNPKKIVGFSSGASSFFYTEPVQRRWNEGYSEIDRNLDLLRSVLGSEKIKPWSEQVQDYQPVLLEANHIKNHQDPKVVMDLGDPSDQRRWDLRQAAELAKLLCKDGVEVHLVGEGAAQIKAMVDSLLLFDKSNEARRSLSDKAKILEASKVLISSNLFHLHLGCELGVPVVALMGGAMGELGFAPWTKRATLLGVAGQLCVACEREALGVKPMSVVFSKHSCVLGLAYDRVYRDVTKFLS